MANINVEVQGRNVAYKCFGCLKLRNPLKKKPVLVNAITAIAPDQQGRIGLQINTVHLCPWCFKKNKWLGNFADPVDIDPRFGQQQQPQQGPQAMVDKSTEMPRQPDGRPRKKGGKLSLK